MVSTGHAVFVPSSIATWVRFSPSYHAGQTGGFGIISVVGIAAGAVVLVVFGIVVVVVIVIVKKSKRHQGKNEYLNSQYMHNLYHS